MERQHGYSQPEGYRFSHDSIELATRAVGFIRASAEEGLLASGEIQILDLCAGCGVVGLEIARRWPPGDSRRSLALHACEIQSEYEPHFLKNEAWIRAEAPALGPAFWHGVSYATLADSLPERFDFVVSNPPYFDRDQGSLPPSEFKARCRFFVDSDFETFLNVVVRALKRRGEALILVRDLRDHGLDRGVSLQRILSPAGEWRALEPVRGTELIHFKKF